MKNDLNELQRKLTMVDSSYEITPEKIKGSTSFDHILELYYEQNQEKILLKSTSSYEKCT